MSAKKSEPTFREVYGDDVADLVASIANDPTNDEAARKAQRERAEADRTAKHMQLVETAGAALAGRFDKETKLAVERVLAGQTPRKAEVASLVLCESIVREYWKRRRAGKRPAGRRAP